MKRKISLTLALMLLLVVVPGCSLLRSGNDAASTFRTFETTWTVTLAAYDAYCDRVNLDKVAPEKVALADAAWNQFRATFKAAFLQASRNWNSQPPPIVELQANNFITMVKDF